MLILLISIFLILNKKTLFWQKKEVILMLSNKIINYGFEIFNSRDLRIIFKDLRFRDLEILDSSWGYWFLVQGLKWQFSTFTLVLVTHLTELFNVRDWSDNGTAESGTSLYLIQSQGPM